MNKTKSFFKNYKYEFFAFIIDIVLLIIAYFSLPYPYNILISFIILLFSTFFIIYIKTKDKDFYFYPFDKPGQEFDWVGRGDLKYIRNEKCFEITRSDVGYILPKTSSWDDYNFELDFKITKTSFGFIVRADNLSNCLMYQIFCDRIKSHFRINGEWIVTEEDKFDNGHKLSLDNWYKLIVTAEKRRVRVQIENQKQSIIDRYLSIESEIILGKKEFNESGIETNRRIFYKQKINFDFGSVGIRNYGNERALIKNIFIKKL